MSIEEKRQQVRKQSEAVAYMARSLANIHDKYNAYVLDGLKDETIIDAMGRQTHQRMELLGDMINAMDAAFQSDETRLNRIFRKAREMFSIEKQ